MPTAREIMDDALPTVAPHDTVESVVKLLRERDVVEVVTPGD